MDDCSGYDGSLLVSFGLTLRPKIRWGRVRGSCELKEHKFEVRFKVSAAVRMLPKGLWMSTLRNEKCDNERIGLHIP